MDLREIRVGAGVYALSEAGRARFRAFPEVIADDLFVQNTFSREERHVVQTDATLVQAPHTVRALFRRRVRVCIGNQQLRTTQPGRILPWWRVIVAHPQLLPNAVVYATINLLARIAAGRQQRGNNPVQWGRDDTTRPAS